LHVRAIPPLGVALRVTLGVRGLVAYSSTVAAGIWVEPKVLGIQDEAQTCLATLGRQMDGHHHGLVEDSIEFAEESAAADREFRLVPHEHDALAARGCKFPRKRGHVAAWLHLAPDFDGAAPIVQASD